MTTTERRAHPALWASLLAALGVAACEDSYTITRVSVIGPFTRSHVVSLAAGGLPTEIHGQPFPGLMPAEIVSRLRGPQTYPAEMRFRAVAQGERAQERRLVLVFNRSGVPNHIADCRATGPIPTQQPREQGFTVTATFCTGHQPDATGHMEATSPRADDPEAFARVMRLLFHQILP